MSTCFLGNPPFSLRLDELIPCLRLGHRVLENANPLFLRLAEFELGFQQGTAHFAERLDPNLSILEFRGRNLLNPLQQPQPLLEQALDRGSGLGLIGGKGETGTANKAGKATDENGLANEPRRLCMASLLC